MRKGVAVNKREIFIGCAMVLLIMTGCQSIQTAARQGNVRAVQGDSVITSDHLKIFFVKRPASDEKAGPVVLGSESRQ